MLIYNMLSKLLDYPDQELKDSLTLIAELLATESGLEEAERKKAQDFVAWMQGMDLLKLQEAYVQTFDLTPEHSLHLTHHLFGDDRGRGPALIDLTEHYKGAGLQAHDGELPDYLPLFLEFLSVVPEAEACELIGETAHILEAIRQRLKKRKAPYSSVFSSLLALSRSEPAGEIGTASSM